MGQIVRPGNEPWALPKLGQPILKQVIFSGVQLIDCRRADLVPKHRRARLDEVAVPPCLVVTHLPRPPVIQARP